MTSYKRISLTKFIEKLGGGGYKHIVGANRAIGRSNLNDKEKKKARSAVEKHFLKALDDVRKVLPKNKRRPARRKKTKTMDVRFSRQLPFAVTFHRLNTDEKVKETCLQFLRAALDDGQTLPELVQAMESV